MEITNRKTQGVGIRSLQCWWDTQVATWLRQPKVPVWRLGTTAPDPSLVLCLFRPQKEKHNTLAGPLRGLSFKP